MLPRRRSFLAHFGYPKRFRRVPPNSLKGRSPGMGGAVSAAPPPRTWKQLGPAPETWRSAGTQAGPLHRFPTPPNAGDGQALSQNPSLGFPPSLRHSRSPTGKSPGSAGRSKTRPRAMGRPAQADGSRDRKPRPSTGGSRPRASTATERCAAPSGGHAGAPPRTGCPHRRTQVASGSPRPTGTGIPPPAGSGKPANVLRTDPGRSSTRLGASQLIPVRLRCFASAKCRSIPPPWGQVADGRRRGGFECAHRVSSRTRFYCP